MNVMSNPLKPFDLAVKQDSALLVRATLLAVRAHAGQVRRFSDEGEPYICHPLRVAHAAASLDLPVEMVAAAILHDVVEDTSVTADEIGLLFGPAVQSAVAALTDVYTKRAYPQLNRRARKQLEAERLAQTVPDVQTVKLLDIQDNWVGIRGDAFATVFHEEARALLALLIHARPGVRDRLSRSLAEVGP